MTAGRLLFRTDANVTIGTGHMMRCLALAQAWQDEGGDAAFAVAEIPVSLEQRLKAEDIELIRLSPCVPEEDSHRTIESARQVNAEWVVVDGYQFGLDYQHAIKQSGKNLLLLDDNGHGAEYVADLVLNPNIHANESLYPKRAPHTRLLLGPRYALLRREFKAYAGRKWKSSRRVRNLLVTFGGSDPVNLTCFVLEALQRIKDKDQHVTVVVGGGNPHLSNLQELAAGARFPLQLIIDASDMAAIMAEADIVISAAGSTCWEMCFTGLPAIIVDVAPNQTALAQSLAQSGAAIHIPRENLSPEMLLQHLEYLLESPDARRSMSAKTRELVDGTGAARVLASMSKIRLRPTLPEDSQLLWRWANDPQVRAMSFSTEPIPWERHAAWFSTKLSDPSALLYIATDTSGRQIGHIRYEVDGARAAVSLSVAPEFRGIGYGKKMLLLGIEELFRGSGTKAIDAFVKPCNAASLRVFKAAGFRNEGIIRVRGQEAVHLRVTRTH